MSLLLAAALIVAVPLLLQKKLSFQITAKMSQNQQNHHDPLIEQTLIGRVCKKNSRSWFIAIF